MQADKLALPSMSDPRMSSSGKKDIAYSAPRPKRKATDSFELRLSWMFHSKGMGLEKSANTENIRTRKRTEKRKTNQ